MEISVEVLTDAKQARANNVPKGKALSWLKEVERHTRGRAFGGRYDGKDAQNKVDAAYQLLDREQA